MNDEPTPICEECEAVYVVEDVYAVFRRDFESRVGFAFTGRRPLWTERFCSEPCRYAAERRRIEGHQRTSSERRTAAGRKAKRDSRPADGGVV